MWRGYRHGFLHEFRHLARAMRHRDRMYWRHYGGWGRHRSQGCGCCCLPFFALLLALPFAMVALVMLRVL